MAQKQNGAKSAAWSKKKMSESQIRKFLKSLDSKYPRALEVVWLDAFSRRGWKDWDSLIKSEMRIRTVGFFLSDNNDYVHLAVSIHPIEDDKNDFSDYWGIPIGMIQNIREL